MERAWRQRAFPSRGIRTDRPRDTLACPGGPAHVDPSIAPPACGSPPVLLRLLRQRPRCEHLPGPGAALGAAARGVLPRLLRATRRHTRAIAVGRHLQLAGGAANAAPAQAAR